MFKGTEGNPKPRVQLWRSICEKQKRSRNAAHKLLEVFFWGGCFDEGERNETGQPLCLQGQTISPFLFLRGRRIFTIHSNDGDILFHEKAFPPKSSEVCGALAKYTKTFCFGICFSKGIETLTFFLSVQKFPPNGDEWKIGPKKWSDDVPGNVIES